MSLAQLQTKAASNAGRPLHIEHPVKRIPLYADTDESGDSPTKSAPVVFHLLGRDSKAFIQANQAARERTIEGMKKRVKYSAAEDDKLAASTLAACTAGWENVPMGWVNGTDDETPAPFSKENAEKLYDNEGVFWVRDQVNEFIDERANFL
jgi:hypothetical protein